MKKFVSVLLVLCCLMASCVHALAEKAALEDYLLGVLQAYCKDDKSIGLYYNVSLDSERHCYIIKVSSQNTATFATCDPKNYKEIKDSYAELLVQITEMAWEFCNDSYCVEIDFFFSRDFSGEPFLIMSSEGAVYTINETKLPINADTNSFVKEGADPAIFEKINELYGQSDFLQSVIYADGDYGIRVGGAFSTSFIKAKQEGTSSGFTKIRDKYASVLQTIADIAPNKVSLYFTDADGNFVYCIVCEKGKNPVGMPL